MKFEVSLGQGQGLRIDLGPLRAQLSRRSAAADGPKGDTAAQAERLRGALDSLVLANLSTSAARISAITVPELRTEENRRRATELLQREGIVVVPGFSDSGLVDRIATRVRQVLGQHRQALESGTDTEDDLLVVDVNGKRFRTYRSLAAYPKTVLNVRNRAGGTDSGMIDIFNFDRCSPQDAADIRELIGGGDVRILLQKLTGDAWLPRNFNVYVNRGITNPRGFHVDSYGGNQIKVFLYLTDVLRLADGPYCYVMGSHRDEGLHAVNQSIASTFRLKASTDHFVVDHDRIVPVLATRGSLIISNQSGAHRGFPQAPGAERILAVMNFAGDAE